MKVYKFPSPERIEMVKPKRVVEPVLTNKQLTIMQHEAEVIAAVEKIERLKELLAASNLAWATRQLETTLNKTQRILAEQTVKLHRAKESI